MPTRALNLWLALPGLLLVAALILIGADIALSARRGPRWKRKLVGAGIALLALLGVPALREPKSGEPPAASREETTSNPDRPSSPSTMFQFPGLSFEAFPIRVGEEGGDEGDGNGEGGRSRDVDLAATPQWQSVAKAWKEGREVASGKRGQYPFDAKGKKTLLEALKSVPANLDVLERAGLLTPAETGFLKKELRPLIQRVEGYRTVEQKRMTCYEPMAMPDPKKVSLEYLRTRLYLLEGLAAQKKISKALLEKVLGNVENHVKRLEGEKKKDVQDLRRKAQALLASLRGVLSGEAPEAERESPLAGHPAWQRFMNAWMEGKEVTSGRRGSYPFDREGKARLLRSLEAAGADLDLLAKEGLISVPGAGLLKMEIPQLANSVRALRPKEMVRATCYRPAPPPRGGEIIRGSTRFLKERVALLEQLAAEKKLRPEVIQKALGGIESHLGRMERERGDFAKLPEEEQAEAKALRDKVKDLLAKIKSR
ncbi:MAG: hypothetical protein ACYTHM_11600 [Planctomycetota bacterium]